MPESLPVVRLLTLLTIVTLLAACGNSGKTLFETDAGPIEDSSGTTDIKPGETAGDTAADCTLVCKFRECGELDGCNCGNCGPGETCDEQFKCIEDTPPDCTEQCATAGVECGGLEGTQCDCGDCGDPDQYFCNEEEGVCEEWLDPWADCPEQCVAAGAECGIVEHPEIMVECDCGECGEGEECEAGLCHGEADPCIAVCEDKACGDWDGCECGSCGNGEVCDTEGTCVPETNCNETCAFQDCGDFEGCDCGECNEGYECVTNKCKKLDPCNDVCAGLQCGSVGDCNCGTCTFGQCLDGECTCVPNCNDVACGPDGCGGNCGDCAANEVCAWDGQCHSDCNPDEIPFSDIVQKIVTLVFGIGGHPGEALDVDNDGATCAPPGDCEQGLDNNLSGLFGQLSAFVDVNDQMMSMVDSGGLVLLAEFLSIHYDGTPFTINMFMGEAVKPKNQCNFQTQFCEYVAYADGIDGESCKPIMWFDNSVIVDGKLHAGGPEYKFSMMIQFLPGIPLTITLYLAQIIGDVSTNQGGAITIDNGVIGGAIPKQLLLDAIDQMPDDGGLPISKDMIKNLLNMFIVPDMDSNGDGELDAASVGMKFNAIGGSIIGVQ